MSIRSTVFSSLWVITFLMVLGSYIIISGRDKIDVGVFDWVMFGFLFPSLVVGNIFGLKPGDFLDKQSGFKFLPNPLGLVFSTIIYTVLFFLLAVIVSFIVERFRKNRPE